MIAGTSVFEARVDLAHAAPFALGSLTVRPATREVIAQNGAREVIEPRVMQVLVALVRADGAIVSRDDLTRSCWEGRVVGDDAINRVMSRLRRMAEGIAARHIRIETVTKVGYRLLCDRQSSTGGTMPGTAPPPVTAPRDSAAARLIDHAFVLIGQDTPDASAQAVGLLRRAVELAPDDAEAWGSLSLAYTAAARLGASATREALRIRARAAVEQTRAIDPGNVFAIISAAALLTTRDNWLTVERNYRAGLEAHPSNSTLLAELARLLFEVGRNGEAAQTYERAVAGGDPAPALLYARVQALMAAGRLEAADGAIAQAYQLYPSHAGVWFTRLYLLLFTGRADQALAIVTAEARPTGIPERDFTLVELVARAIATRDTADVDRAVAANIAAAREGSGYAENAIQFCAALERVDEAFALAAALYFGRGFAVPEYRFSAQQGIYESIESRPTWYLFALPTLPMRADPRFDALVKELGLTRYWGETATAPDYRG